LVTSGPDLVIPERFVLVDQPMLQSPWTELRWTWGYLRDVMVNIAGFIPLGFFLYACWLERQWPQPMIAAVLICTATSLAIELIQAYLPTRNSGVTDLFTNTFGTYLGAMSYRFLRRAILLRLDGFVDLRVCGRKDVRCKAKSENLVTAK